MKKIAAAVLMVGLMAAPAWAETATAPASIKTQSASASSVVKAFYAQLVEAMKGGEQLGFGGRYKKLEPAVTAAYNLPMMARLAVGPNWALASAEEQAQLVKAFSSYSIATYASRFAAYDGEQFSVIGEKPAAGGMMVETKLQPAKGEAVALNYMMRQDTNGAWRIVDVFMNGTISELATRRAEFTSVIKREGMNALVNSLGEKSKHMGPG